MNSMRGLVVGVAVLPLLAACGEKVPEATDEQILQLLGSNSPFFGSDAPLSISKRTAECAELLSGLADEIVKDMPEEVLGRIKTECRKNFDEVVKDPAKNPMGFKLAHFESKELAGRIAALKASTDEANRRAAQEERARAEQEARAKTESELKDLRSSYGEFVASIDGRVQEAKAVCDEWATVRTEVNAKIKWNNWRNRNPSPLCTDQVSDIREKARQHLEALNAAEVSGSGTFFSFQKPYFGTASVEWFDDQLARLKDEISQMKATLTD
ncbi:hypothetical protein [Agrobacterium tumefaciens]|uniref:hypothetical protein n=1 Tax=Agrobacterium tumefaciens TaxID=358 RepID=UPI002242DFBF|nr:hypothetical protein [Agrobacterium tumefaciens]